MPTITATAAGNADLSILVAALDFIDTTLGTDYLGTLDTPGADLTVFAPTNDAFGLLASDLGYTGDAAGVGAFLLSLGADDQATAELLEDIVTYHVSAGAKDAAAIDALTSVATLYGQDIDVSMFDLTVPDTTLIDREPDTVDPTVSTPNVPADNGIVHLIDRVLIPEDLDLLETITGLVTADDGEFDILQSALSAAGLVDLFNDPAQDFTVFAPTDAAFVELAKDLGFTGDETDEASVFGFIAGALDTISGGDAIGLLTSILQYHVSAGEQLLADVAAAGSVTTILEPDPTGAPGTFATLGVNLATGQLVDAEPDTVDPTLVDTDVQATNGVVHVIDRVLIPADLPQLETITGTVVASDSFDILELAVTTAGLGGVLGDIAAEFTVFAPTDAAFIALAETLGFDGDTADEAAVFTYIAEALTLFSAGESPVPLLTDILLYHVAAGRLALSDVAAAGSVDTLLEVAPGTPATIGVNLTDLELVDGDPDLPDPGLVETDVAATNGLIHVIDGVLIPVDLLASDGSGDVDFIIDGDGGSRILTGDDNDLIDGNGGNDVIHAGKGNDIALGGDGNDILTGNSGADILKGEAGHDLIRGQNGKDTLDGGEGDDFVTGGRGSDMAHGGEGDDTIFGGGGNDMISGDGDDDALFGARGSDTLEGGDGEDALTGGGGSDLLEGGDDDDNLLGGFGNDTLDGGADDDFIVTGFGHDVIVFREGDGHDTVLDFNIHRDQIDVSDFGFADYDALHDAGVIDRGFFSTTLHFGEDAITLIGFAGGIDADNFIF